jgi:hypothetical protein
MMLSGTSLTRTSAAETRKWRISAVFGDLTHSLGKGEGDRSIVSGMSTPRIGSRHYL